MPLRGRIASQSPVESPTVATYPSTGGRRVTRRCMFQERNTRGVATNFYLRKTSKNPEKRDLRILSERFWSCIYAWGRYQHPTRPSQETTAFNQMCKYDFNLYSFPFFTFLCIFNAFLCFYLFVVDKGVSLCSYVFLNCDEKIKPTQFFVNKAFWLFFFILFCKICVF